MSLQFFFCQYLMLAISEQLMGVLLKLIADWHFPQTSLKQYWM